MTTIIIHLSRPTLFTTSPTKDLNYPPRKHCTHVEAFNKLSNIIEWL